MLLAAMPAHAQTYPSILATNSPLDWWRFDESVTSPAINEIANSAPTTGTNGTGYVVGGVTLGQTGVVGNSAFFSNPGQGTGNCSARIDIPNSPMFNPVPPFSIEFWAMPNAPWAPSDTTGLAPVSSISICGSASDEGARSGYTFYVNSTGWSMRIGGLQSYSAVVTANTGISTTNFTHVVGEFDGTTAFLYINGVLAASIVAEGGPFSPNNFFPTRIGGSSLPGSEYEDANGQVLFGSGNRGWDGWVDEFAVYNTLLSSNTIMAHYTAGTTSPSTYDALVLASSPIGYWHLDEPAYTTPNPSNTVAADSGSLADFGTNTLGALADQAGVPGTGDKSVFYNGAAGSLVLDTGVTNLLDIAGGSLTLAAWINPLSFGFVSDIIAQGYDEATYSENFLRVGDSYDWAYFQDNSSGGNYNTNVVPDVDFYEVGAFTGGNPGYVSAVFPAPPGDIGHWVFLVGTYDSSTANWNLYRNGNLVAQFADPLPTPGPAPVNIPWAVGSRSNPNPYFGMFFAGEIAEASIMTNALDAATISNLYNSAALPPVITAAPIAPSPAYLGSAATFSVWADGSGTLAYQWYSNGVAVSGQTGTNFSLSGLTAASSADYSVVVSNAYGSVTSAVALVVTPTLPPVTLAPATETRWLGFPLSFAPASLPSQQLSFQWQFDGSAISGATLSSYTAPANTAGSYTLVISNGFAVATSTVATLSIKTSPDAYVSTILADQPLAYLRLDESSGPTAYDYAGGNNGTYFGNITLGVPGYSLIDTDTAAFFPGTALSYVGNINPDINFAGKTSEFSIEAWANGGPNQISGAAVIAKGHSNNGTTANQQFAIIVTSGNYAFFVGDDKADEAAAVATTGPDGSWHHLVGVCDEVGGAVTLYIDGAVASSASTSSLDAGGIINQLDPVSIGSESSGPDPTYDIPYDGTISQVAIYPTNLSPSQVYAHYAAAYGTNLAPFITTQPVSVTNYITYPVSLSVAAAGSVPLTYQWNKVGSGAISGATTATYTVANPSASDNGTYTVTIANNVGTTNSLPATITILPVPTNPPSISSLVVHLTFDNTLEDASGRGNNATYETSGTFTTTSNPLTFVPGQIGEAFVYETDVNTNSFANGGLTNAYYATLGVRPDLQFGSSVSFTVSMWVQLPPNYGTEETSYSGNDLPFFTDTIGSTFGAGYVFAPSFGGPTADTPGGFAYSLGGTTSTIGAYGAKDLINDGNWHNLIYVVDRTAAAVVVYLDGQVGAQTVEAAGSVASVGDIDVANAATIGQDPTGLYPQASDGQILIDDLGVWTRALTPLEAESIFLAGSVNQLSFTGATNTLTLTTTTTNGTQLTLSFGSGTLQGATNLSGPWTTISNITSPYTVSPTNTLEFFRAKF